MNCNQATIIRGWGPGHQHVMLYQTRGYGGSILYKPNLELCVNIVMPIVHNNRIAQGAASGRVGGDCKVTLAIGLH